MNIMEQLAARIRAMKNQTIAGLDTRIEYLPESFVNEILPQGIHTFEDAAEAVYRYNVRLIDALCDIVPSVKVQVAYYEMYGPAGMVAYDKTIRYAKEKGMIVMADVKRNDIGATAACYANAYIGTTDMPDGAQRAFAADIATINPYLGVDGVKPFADACRDHGTGSFGRVKTSNPSSARAMRPWPTWWSSGARRRAARAAILPWAPSWARRIRSRAPHCARGCRMPSSSCRAMAHRARPARISPGASMRMEAARSSTRPVRFSVRGRSARAWPLTKPPARKPSGCARICAAA